ncbi:unnamed protein product [Linum tenue]|uniref:Uncharacterized protein n=1 Tax=Linum tenue TaxID=586396 RepID=A0AAV0P339_9ROSI|nr:unnamed protein product [Linum tenue]
MFWTKFCPISPLEML